MEEHHHGCGCGTLYVVGTGPGSLDHIVPAAATALKNAQIIIGYAPYLDLINDLISDKKIISSQMMKEVDRCRQALELTEQGNHVVLVSGGDPGIYAMAGLVFELARDMNLDCAIEVIPGIAAVNSCASRLGAPLMHDFAAISLSDLLTPWEIIEKRLTATAMADFVVAIYNPKSKKRTEHILKAQKIFLEHRHGETPVGIVTNATRENETIALTTLANLHEAEITMQSTVLIGNSQTFIWRGKMITPRGYSDKYGLK